MNQPIRYDLAIALDKAGVKIKTKLVWQEITEHEMDIPRDGVETFPGRPLHIGSRDGTSFEEYKIVHCSAPTISEVISYLYDNYKIWICVQAADEYKFEFSLSKWIWYEPEKTYRQGLIQLGDCYLDCYSSEEYSSPELAYEAAIEYVLNIDSLYKNLLQLKNKTDRDEQNG